MFSDLKNNPEQLSRSWHGLSFENLSEVFSLLACNQLRVLDVGCANNSFLANLISSHGENISSAVGIDIAGSGESESTIAGIPIKIKRGVSLEKFSIAEKEKFELIFLNCTAIPTGKQSNIDCLKKLLMPGGALIVTYHWESFLTGMFNAFDEPEDIVNFLAPIAAMIPNLHKTLIWQITNTSDYPDATYRPVPSPLVLFLNDINFSELEATSRVASLAILTNAFKKYASIWSNKNQRGESISLRYDHGAIYTIDRLEDGKDLWEYINESFQPICGNLYKIIIELSRDMSKIPKDKLSYWEKAQPFYRLSSSTVSTQE